MPHATEDMSQQMVNGEKLSSQFIGHLTSYPVVSDSIETFKSNPYGKKSLEIADSAYSRFGKPVEPYLETPKQYVAPYAKKADELATSGLGHVETHFPIVKEDTNTIVDKGKSWVFWPFKLAGDGRNYVVHTYSDEYNKTAAHKDRGAGLTTFVMAVISTELKIASDFFQAVADFLGPKYEEGKQKASDYAAQAQDTAEHYKQVGQEKLGEAKKIGEDKYQEYAKLGQEKAEQAKQEAEKTKDQAKQEAQKTKDEAQKKAK